MRKRGTLDETLAVMFSSQDNSTLLEYLYYAHIIGQCSIKICDIDAPAGVSFNMDHYELLISLNAKHRVVDGKEIRIPGFDDYTLHERLAILKHEALHILNRHVERTEDRNHSSWNYSTDCAINQFINRKHLPESAILPDFFKQYSTKVKINESAEYYYELIKDSSAPENCDHGTWELSTGDKELQSDITKKMIEVAADETMKNIGTLPSEHNSWLDLCTRSAEIDWRRALRRITGNKRISSRPTIMRKDRRFPNRADLRGKIKERSFNVLVIADVSGSMSDDAVLSTLGEVRGVCDVTHTGVDLIQVDVQAYLPEKLSKSTKLITRKGRGGTYLSLALDMASECNIDYQAVVALTDGGLLREDIASFINIGKPVIWLVEPDGIIKDGMELGKMRAFKLRGDK